MKNLSNVRSLGTQPQILLDHLDDFADRMVPIDCMVRRTCHSLDGCESFSTPQTR